MCVLRFPLIPVKYITVSPIIQDRVLESVAFVDVDLNSIIES